MERASSRIIDQHDDSDDKNRRTKHRQHGDRDNRNHFAGNLARSAAFGVMIADHKAMMAPELFVDPLLDSVGQVI